MSLGRKLSMDIHGLLRISVVLVLQQPLFPIELFDGAQARMWIVYIKPNSLSQSKQWRTRQGEYTAQMKKTPRRTRHLRGTILGAHPVMWDYLNSGIKAFTFTEI